MSNLIFNNIFNILWPWLDNKKEIETIFIFKIISQKNNINQYYVSSLIKH